MLVLGEAWCGVGWQASAGLRPHVPTLLRSRQRMGVQRSDWGSGCSPGGAPSRCLYAAPLNACALHTCSRQGYNPTRVLGVQVGAGPMHAIWVTPPGFSCDGERQAQSHPGGSIAASIAVPPAPPLFQGCTRLLLHKCATSASSPSSTNVPPMRPGPPPLAGIHLQQGQPPCAPN